MKSAVYYAPGDVRVEEIPTPVAGPGEVLMKNVSALTCGTDLKQYRRGYPSFKPGETRPFGHESAGTVAAVGSGVTKFKVGDRIMPHNTAPCNACYFCRVGQHSMCDNLTYTVGGWCEYRLIPAPVVEQNTFIIPDEISFRAAALIEPLGSAVHGVEQAEIHLMDTVAINGAGPLGLMMTKVAKMRGAHVIVSDLNEKRLKVAKELGADEIIDVSKVDDHVDAVRQCTPYARGVDSAIDGTGLPEIWEKNIDMVRKGGIVVEFGGCKAGTTITVDTTRLHYDQIIVKGLYHTTPRLVEQSYYLIARGEIGEEHFINNTYSLDDCIEALEEHARGDVIKNEIRCEA